MKSLNPFHATDLPPDNISKPISIPPKTSENLGFLTYSGGIEIGFLIFSRGVERDQWHEMG